MEKIKLTITVDEKLAKEAKKTAIDEGRSVGAIFEELFTRYLAEKR